MNKSIMLDISETIIYGESGGLSPPINYQQYPDNVKLLEKYKQCMEKYKQCMDKYKQYKSCKYLLNKVN